MSQSLQLMIADNGDDDGDHIGVDDYDKDEKDSVVKEVAVYNKGSLPPILVSAHYCPSFQSSNPQKSDKR